jgi:glucose-6-phosphate-specific signal transduction histidine kinase
MFEAIVMLLIYICLVVGACWLVMWVLQQLGVALPDQVVKIFWVIVVLIVILLLYRTLAPVLGGGKLL